MLAYLLWALPARGQSSVLYLQLAPLLSLFIVGYARAGLYPGFGLGPVEITRRLSYVTAFGFLVLAAFSFALKLPPLYSRVTFTLAFAFSLVTVPVTRVLVSALARRWQWWNEPVVVVGTGERAARAIRRVQEAGHFDTGPPRFLQSMLKQGRMSRVSQSSAASMRHRCWLPRASAWRSSRAAGPTRSASAGRSIACSETSGTSC